MALSADSNPLLDIRFRIPFDQIRAEHVEPAIHELPVKGEGDLLNLVRSAVLLTDWLGFDVTPPMPVRTITELEVALSEPARAWLEADMEPKRNDITHKLDSFD